MSFESELTSHYADVRRRLYAPLLARPDTVTQPVAEPVLMPPCGRVAILRGSRAKEVLAPESKRRFAGKLVGLVRKQPYRIIAQLVAAKHGLPEAAMYEPGRFRQVAKARFEAMYLIYTHTDWGTDRIGRAFNRDHSTVMHAIDTYAKRNGLPTIFRGNRGGGMASKMSGQFSPQFTISP